MSESTVEPAAEAPVAKLSFFDRVKAEVFKIESETMAEAHAAEAETLKTTHAAITGPEELFEHIREKL